MRDEYATRTTWRYHNQPFRLIVAAQKPCDFVSRKHLILCVRIFPNGRIRKSCFWATADAGGTGDHTGLHAPDRPSGKIQKKGGSHDQSYLVGPGTARSPHLQRGYSIAVQSPKPAEKKPTLAKKEKKPQCKK